MEQVEQFIKQKVEEAGATCQVVVCSAGHLGRECQSVDVVPQGAGKVSV